VASNTFYQYVHFIQRFTCIRRLVKIIMSNIYLRDAQIVENQELFMRQWNEMERLLDWTRNCPVTNCVSFTRSYQVHEESTSLKLTDGGDTRTAKSVSSSNSSGGSSGSIGGSSSSSTTTAVTFVTRSYQLTRESSTTKLHTHTHTPEGYINSRWFFPTSGFSSLVARPKMTYLCRNIGKSSFRYSLNAS